MVFSNSSFANTTNTTTTLIPADMAIAIHSIIISFFGLITNGLTLAVILSSKTLRSKDYICFILNRILNDFIYCILLGSLHPISILTQSSSICSFTGFVDVSVAMSTIFAEPMLACNRYISIFHSNQHKKIYGQRNVYLMCIVVWILGFVCTVPHIFTRSLGRVPGVVCCVTLTRENVLVTMLSNYIPVFISVALVGIFNYKIFVFLRQHQTLQMSNAQRSKLQSDREMSRFIIAAACLPLIFQIPLVTAFWVQMFVPLSEWLLFFVTALFVMMFAVNPLVALLMVRPLRNQFLKISSKFRGRTIVSAINSQPKANSTQDNKKPCEERY